MKANNTNSLFGISGIEEFEAIKALALETQKANQLVAELDDDGCNIQEPMEFDEEAYLDDAREGAGYESAWQAGV